MQVLWVVVDDDPGPKSDRGIIESGSIVLLSNRLDPPDPPSATWLGSVAPTSSDPEVRPLERSPRRRTCFVGVHDRLCHAGGINDSLVTVASPLSSTRRRQRAISSCSRTCSRPRRPSLSCLPHHP